MGISFYCIVSMDCMSLDIGKSVDDIRTLLDGLGPKQETNVKNVWVLIDHPKRVLVLLGSYV